MKNDLISRQAALNQITAIDTSIIPYVRAREYVDELKNYVIKIIETLPSAEPERTAKVYKKQTTDRLYQFYCGECCQMIDCSFYEDYKSIKSYCGYCGAKLDWSE